MNDGPRNTAEVRSDETFTRRVLDRGAEILSNLDYALGELGELRSRNHGPSPTEAAGAGKLSESSGRFGEIEQLLEQLAARADQVRGTARFLNVTH